MIDTSVEMRADDPVHRGRGPKAQDIAACSGDVGFEVRCDQPRLRRLAFMTAIVLYLLGLLDMGINVLVSGVVGWHSFSP